MTESDRDLLERAAEAAGIDHIGVHADGEVYAHNVDCTDTKPWNPLTNSGDALELAVKLELQLDLRHSTNAVSIYGAPDGRIDEGAHHDPVAATRRAIVRAAAALSS
jgi:hypothetical protein